MRYALNVALGLAIVCAAGFGVFYLLRYSLAGFVGLEKDVAKAVVVVSGTVLISVISLILSKHYERRSEIHRELREKKVPVYLELMDFWFKLITAPQLGKKQPTDTEIVKFMSEFTKKIITWGSDDVLKGFYRFRHAAIAATPEGKAPIETLFLFEKLLLEMRKDLGHSNKNIQKGDILALWVNDVDAHL